MENISNPFHVFRNHFVISCNDSFEVISVNNLSKHYPLESKFNFIKKALQFKKGVFKDCEIKKNLIICQEYIFSADII